MTHWKDEIDYLNHLTAREPVDVRRAIERIHWRLSALEKKAHKVAPANPSPLAAEERPDRVTATEAAARDAHTHCWLERRIATLENAIDTGRVLAADCVAKDSQSCSNIETQPSADFRQGQVYVRSHNREVPMASTPAEWEDIREATRAVGRLSRMPDAQLDYVRNMMGWGEETP